ncbi:unnamed protein product [Penicillium olsonii]|uniref:Uncharacterized protein n=1 Tax=Penicillium olsonii TaxID=99116 RepID=A0A9W4IDY3_PENOL|nr:unnamed protein product [Penicillium olsonii]CAG8266577.1 unnamed protein product [Penicillium olsonii]
MKPLTFPQQQISKVKKVFSIMDRRPQPSSFDPLGRGDMIDGDKDEAEIAHERNGKFNALQRYRYKSYWSNPKDAHVSAQLLDTEEDLRELVQEELSIKDGPATRETDKRLHVLNTEYWHLSQQWWRLRSDLAPLQLRSFIQWRAQPIWYMHRELVEDCAGRQGCCARGCGCCLDRKLGPSRSLGVGHCTVECACCREARGFELSAQEKWRLKKQFKMDLPKETGRISKMECVSIWGLCSNEWGNPCELIDAPPRYIHVEKDKRGPEEEMNDSSKGSGHET